MITAVDAVDWAGTPHPPAGPSPRIASLVPSLTELLFALHLGDQVVARTGFCVHPRPAVRRVPKVGGTKDPDVARLRALAPTHLVVNVDENRREVVEAIGAFVPHVIVTHPLHPDDNRRLARLFGTIFDRADMADALCRGYDAARAALDRACAGLARERVLYLIWRRPWMTVGTDTYIAASLALAGWDVVTLPSGSRYPELADDAPAWHEADRILLSTEPYAFRPRDCAVLREATGKPATLIDGTWTSWYGVRAIEGLRALAGLRAQLAGDQRAGPPP
jgi:ABC-type Fe3+-hydroxamate transport system substrate-binding protein